MSYRVNAITGELDIVGLDAVTEFPATGFILDDASGGRWRVTVDTAGHLITTLIVNTLTGQPYGLLLALTQP